MSETPVALPPLLSSPSRYQIPSDMDRINVSELKKVARRWLGKDSAKLAKDPIMTALRAALKSDEAARLAVNSMTPAERQVVAVYRRYGGRVGGSLIRIDLMARGILELVEDKRYENYTYSNWKSNPVEGLVNQWVLISEHSTDPNYHYHSYGHGADKKFDLYSLHPGIAKFVEPAGSVAWSIPPASGVAHEITRRTPAEVALSLSRVLSFVSARGSLKMRKSGGPGTPALTTLEKGVPIEEDSEFLLPDPQAFYLDILMGPGAIVSEAGVARADAAAATKLFIKPDLRQAHDWAASWLKCRNWWDGHGATEAGDSDETSAAVRNVREILAWALGGLARAGDHWYELHAFVSSLYPLMKGITLYLPGSRLPWDPKFPEGVGTRDFSYQGPDRQRAFWFGKEGPWMANALMVTLVELGMIERGRLGPRKSDPLGFRLTETGRAVFGAPEVVPASVQREQKFLVIQPNFDVIAYLGQADALSAGYLGRLAESDSSSMGPVHTFRLTQVSIYQAQESGLSQADIVDFLRKHSEREPPPNVIQAIADWSVKRERLTLRSGVTLVAFATTAERDTFLKRHPGTSCGERFAITSGALTDKLIGGKSLRADPRSNARRIFTMDEEGLIRSERPIDIVQQAQLRRIAVRTPEGWQISGDSIRQAASWGLKPTWIRRELYDLLEAPIPDLIEIAIDAWTGKNPTLELTEAILLHVSDLTQYQTIATSRRLRPFLLGTPGPHWLAVAQGTRKKFTAILEELGYKVNAGTAMETLSLSSLTDVERL